LAGDEARTGLTFATGTARAFFTGVGVAAGSEDVALVASVAGGVCSLAIGSSSVAVVASMETGSGLVVVASWAAAGVVSATAAALAEVALKRV
jgi:hypothetical protein